MLRASEIWQIMCRYLPRGRWVSVSEIRTIVEFHAKLDGDDYKPEAPGSNIPKWRRNVRNVLVSYKRKGKLHWNGKGGDQSQYFLK
jgi:hypothetical protein